jgi:hypothetical protein
MLHASYQIVRLPLHAMSASGYSACGHSSLASATAPNKDASHSKLDKSTGIHLQVAY